MLDTLNDFDYIGVGIGLTAISVILGGAAYGLCTDTYLQTLFLSEYSKYFVYQ